MRRSSRTMTAIPIGRDPRRDDIDGPGVAALLAQDGDRRGGRPGSRTRAGRARARNKEEKGHEEE